ncbi:MAG: transcriptional regulator MraZ [Acidimicrobiaceae bacterium]|jgi:MraZ protein
MFIGKHDRSLDDKGRLVLPSGYRRAFEDASGGVLAPWDRCLALFPRDDFEVVMRRLLDKVSDGEADDDVARLFSGGAADVQLDAQGRFVIPEEHRTHAAIQREVKVLGLPNRVEIWDAGRFGAMEDGKSADDVSAEIRRLRIF